MADQTTQQPTSAGVRFPPPIIFVAGVLAGWLLDRYVRALPLTSNPDAFVFPAVAVIGFALGLMISGMLTFRRAGTAIIPHHPASHLVQWGPYRFTRNPMYSGLTLVYVAVSALLNSGWPLLLLPVVLFTLTRFVVQREEAYLHAAFGAEYDAYRARVRRWF